ncbi:16S rRNA (adenine(1518)-N(6)/adenine(1519)-N(6))-dimethyltransferase RsmA [Haloplasma contractile]|uniref:16S rRNA (adenine(1518)-N(6)/adenine(1519)-N(6))- dimethyltransferase RsmA n=1 Tax=Haloplasma contractile TaxID=471825 RepID=UPI0002121D65|nr:16S rRNA (adenine(1518)-N(6)/adenine(1519)-N(6))-dimethyltransferase RsmA [Haloplasma contractile]
MNKKDIATITNTNHIIKKYNFHLKKSFGQNFLVDLNILKNIVSSADITEETGVIEIGPGIGALTEQLAKKAKKVVAYEIDQRLIPILDETLQPYNNIIIINEDILKANVNKMIEEEFNGYEDIAVVANLPYYITTPILMGLIEKNLPINRYCVMMQKEVAKRLSGGPNTKEYNSLTIAVNYYTIPKIVLTVPKTVFIPKPNVDSAVVRLDKREEPAVKVNDESFFFKVVRGSFIQRRKTIYNNLKQSLKGVLTTDDIKTALKAVDIKENARGESLTIEQFAKLSNEFIKYVT